MPKYSGLRVLTASLLGVAAFAFAAAADEPKPAPHAAPARPAAAPPAAIHPPGAPGAVPPGMRPPAGAPGAVPPGFHAPGSPAAAPGARPGMQAPAQRGTAFHGGSGAAPAPHYAFRGRDFRHFSPEEQHAWAGGGWHHDWHDGRYGWWWYTDGGWYFYDEPVYPMPLTVSDDYVADPDAVAEEPPPEDPSYYAQPAPAPAPQPQGLPPVQYWYYCDNPAGYYPYVQTCPSQFRPVPATPSQ